MRFKTRYKLWSVAWILLGLYMLLGLISIIALALLPGTEGDKLGKILTTNHMIQIVLSYLFNVFFFYFMTNYFFNFIAEKRKFLSYLKVSLIAVTILFVYDFAVHKTLPDQRGEQYATAGIFLFNMTLNALFGLGVSLLIAYLTNLRDGQKQRKILEAQKMQLEVEKSQANLNFLKAQINPHFLHNTLNFLYAKSLPYSPELSEGILTLSDIMRYALGQGNEKDGKAPLKDEIEHVRNVIKISQLRFSNQLKVNFEVNGVINGAMIIPFVLITLVENAFKHGDLKNQQAPIDIKLNIEGSKLYFYCRNKKKSGPKELSTGIGLENIRNRLDLAYGTKYNFSVKDEPDLYTTELTIDPL